MECRAASSSSSYTSAYTRSMDFSAGFGLEQDDNHDDDVVMTVASDKPAIKEIKVGEEYDYDDDRNINYEETPWKIIGSYFEGQHLQRLVRHQIESYNDFVNNQIQRTIEMFFNASKDRGTSEAERIDQ